MNHARFLECVIDELEGSRTSGMRFCDWPPKTAYVCKDVLPNECFDHVLVDADLFGTETGTLYFPMGDNDGRYLAIDFEPW